MDRKSGSLPVPIPSFLSCTPRHYFQHLARIRLLLSCFHSKVESVRKAKLPLSLVTSSNNRHPRALIELERSWLHELELHELITLRHFQPRTRMVVRIGPIYWNLPVIYQFGPFNGLITSWRWIGGGGRWHDVWSWRQL